MKIMKKTINETFEATETSGGGKKRGGRKNLCESEMSLLFLAPLVETAWAHGAVARSEKQLIFEAARAEGIDEKNALNETLDDLLMYQPGREFFDSCLKLIKAELASMTVKTRELKLAKLVKRCRRIAAAAGGNSAMDVDKFTSPEERAVLTRLTAELNFRDADAPPRERHGRHEKPVVSAVGGANRAFAFGKRF